MGQRCITVHHRGSPSPLAQSSTSINHFSPQPEPILPEPPPRCSLDILVYIHVLHCCLLHVRSHAGAPLENTPLGVASKSLVGERDDAETPCFLNSLPCLCALQGMCVLYCCVYPTMLSYFDAACFGWRSLTSKRGLPISRPSHDHQTRFLLRSLPAHATAYSTCPLSTTTASMDGMDVTAATARYAVLIMRTTLTISHTGSLLWTR